MSLPLVSVVIPNYNNDLYLEKCLDSILSQEYPALEIIVCDDHSSDRSLEIINEYQKRNPHKIHLILNDTNVGVGRNRHKGILSATGAFITTLDSDDFFISSKKILSEVTLALNYLQKGEKVLPFSLFEYVDVDGVGLLQPLAPVKEGNILSSLICRECFIPRDFLFTKEIYLESGAFDFRVTIYEDWDLKIRMASRYKFVFTQERGIGYRRHGNGLSAASVTEHVKWLTFVFDKNFSLVPDSEKSYCSNKFKEFLKTL